MIGIRTLLPGWLLWLALAAPLGALEVGETIWGFDGKVVPGRFNPLSVLVGNPASTVFEGEITLAPSDGAGNRRGAQYVLPVYLAPRTTRWLQFHVFAGNYQNSYVLSWGRGAGDRYELNPAPNLGPPASVWLRDADNPFASAGAMKSFPDALFPTTAAATDGLDAVALDHAPNWEPARREAFRQWLERGGTAHLLPGASGRYPQFSEDLAALNAPQEQTRVGAGRVVRHTIAAREMSAQYLAERGFPERTLQQEKRPVIYDLETILFRQLSSLTRPRVNWTAIHLLALAYIGVIGPLHFRYRRRIDYRISIAAFLGVVALFSTAFAVVGRRGYGESQTVSSLAIARSLGGGRCDVAQWISAFATDGDFYTLTHRAPANLYATDLNSDAAGGRILNGKDGRLLLDIPLYSSRAFLHRAVMNGDDTAVTVVQWDEGSGGHPKLRLRPGPGFPKGFSEARLVLENRVYEVTQRDGLLMAGETAPKTFADLFSQATLSPAVHLNHFRDVDSSSLHRKLMPILAARAVNAPGVFQQAISEPARPADQALLLLVAPSPPSFHLQGKGFTREAGWVLYVQDVFKP